MLKKLTPSELDITNQLAELAFSCLEDPITTDATKLTPIPFTNLEEALTDLVENYTVIKAYPSVNGIKHLDLKFSLQPEFSRLHYFTPQKQAYAINETEFQAYSLLSWLNFDGLEYKFSNFLSNTEIKFFYIETFHKLFKPELKFLQLLQEQLNKYKQYLATKDRNYDDFYDQDLAVNSSSNQSSNSSTPNSTNNTVQTSITTEETSVTAAQNVAPVETVILTAKPSASEQLDRDHSELDQHEQELEEYEAEELRRSAQHDTPATEKPVDQTLEEQDSTPADEQIALAQDEAELASEVVANQEKTNKDKSKKDKSEKSDKDKSEKSDKDKSEKSDKEKSDKDKKDKKEKEKYKSSNLNSLLEKKLLDLLEALTDYKISYDYDQSSSYIESYVSHLVDLKKLAFLQAFNTLTDQYAPYHLESFDCEYESKVVQLCDEIEIDQQAQELVERAVIVPIGNFNRATLFGYNKKESSRGQCAPIPGLLHLPNLTLAITTAQIEQNPQLAIELFDAIKLGSFTLAQAQCYKDAVNCVNLEFKTTAKLIILNNSTEVANLFKQFTTPNNTVSCTSGYVTRANFLLEVAQENRQAFVRDYVINFLKIAQEDKKAHDFLKNKFVQYNINDFVRALEELEQELNITGTTTYKVADFEASTGVDLSLILEDNTDLSKIKQKEVFVQAKLASVDLLDLISPEKVYLHSTLITQLLQETLKEAYLDNFDNNSVIPVCICRQQNLDKCCAIEGSNFAQAQAEQPDLSQHSSKIYELESQLSANITNSASNYTDNASADEPVALDQIVSESVTAGFNKVNHSTSRSRIAVRKSSAKATTNTNSDSNLDSSRDSNLDQNSTQVANSNTEVNTHADHEHTEFKPVDCLQDDNQTCSIANTLEAQAKDRIKVSVDITSEASTTDSGKSNTATFDSSFGEKTNNQVKNKLLALLSRQAYNISSNYERFAEVESGEGLDDAEISLLECFDATSFELKLLEHSNLSLDDIDFSFLNQNSLYKFSKPLLEEAKYYYTELVGRLVALVRLLGYNEQDYPLSYGFINRLLAILFRSSETSFEVIWAINVLDSYLQRSHGRTDLVDAIFKNNHCHNDNEYQDQLHQVLDDYIKITTGDEVVVPGQVNGLACFTSEQLNKEDIGNVFRISCVTNNEQGAVLDVDTEIEFSGSTSTRAHILTSSYLKSLFNENIQFAGTIVTEQLYNEIDGDSASIANFCALASALSKYPLKQYLAVTGAMDQFGNVLAVGGLNHKIEAFFDICKHRGLTGNQGVVIPATNAKSLQLIDEVVEAVEQGLFHIYTADHVSEVFEIMTNIPYMIAQDEEISSQAPDYISCWGDFVANTPSLINAISTNLNNNGQHGHGLFSRLFGKIFKSHHKH